MGIPRFYRYMSERYPLINQSISDVSLLPAFDAFYLDMNGIIHNCTHTDNGDDELNTLSLAAQLHGIFTYMDHLITHIIKPKKLVYIAIDGVAPRAKLNQQRSRRFRAGLEREEAIEKEKHMQMTLEDEKNGVHASSINHTDISSRFDSNSITPGTDFLWNLSQHIIYFIRHKIKNDPLWQRLEVFFSGSEVPGEGEHKIVDFIRRRKMQKGYDSNMRHCMYGSDADLMLLGLMTHEPHFTLVREIVVWGRPGKKTTITTKKIQEDQWQLVHLSLFREYLMKDMNVVDPFDGERMLDDFILLTFLLGNDFIPHSPTLEISEDAIPLLMKVYREHLEKNGGQYLTCEGEICNLELLQALFQTIGDLEEDILVNRAMEQARRYKKRGRNHHIQGVEEEGTISMHGPDLAIENISDALASLSDDDDLPPLIDSDVMAAIEIAEDEDFDIGIDEDEDEEEEEEDADDDDDDDSIKLIRLELANEMAKAKLTGSESFQDTKWSYYQRKFGISRHDHGRAFSDLKAHYLDALKWCLEYYFQGPPSWSWFYPYHYAPMISDLTEITTLPSFLSDLTSNNEADNGPLLPFEQLMANLPASSAHLVPQPYRFLMVSPLSPIQHFYPKKFDVDMEGKKNPWEGVNILPFIDVDLLRSAIAQYAPDSMLTESERIRNVNRMEPLRITYNKSIKDYVPSTMPGIPGFSDIISCQSAVEKYYVPAITIHNGRFRSALMPDVQLPLAGFPSLNTITLASARVLKIGINCFGMSSRKDTLVLEIPNYGTMEDARSLLGSVVLVNWPHLHEAKVIGVSSLEGETILSEDGLLSAHAFSNEEKGAWAQFAHREVISLFSGRGTPGSGGIDLGRNGISILLHVLPLQGMVCHSVTGAVKKVFGSTQARVPYQLTVSNHKLHDERFEETSAPLLVDRFPPKSTALVIDGHWLGCMADIERVNEKTLECVVSVHTMDREPPFGYIIASNMQDTYLPGPVVAKKVGISPTTLGILTGSVVIKPGRFEIGLNLKVRKELMLPGYCRLVPKSSLNASDFHVDNDSHNVWRGRDIVKIVGSEPSIFKPKNNETSSNLGRNSSSNEMTWVYSYQTVDLLKAYTSQFPDVVKALDQLPFALSYSGKELFNMEKKKDIEKYATQIRSWIDDQKLGVKENSKHIPVTSEHLCTRAMLALENAGSLRAVERKPNSKVGYRKRVTLSAGALFQPNSLVNQDLTGSEVSRLASTNKGAPILGDRVVNLTGKGVPFGFRGTVVATHVASRCVEVLFDEGFTGGEALYGTQSSDRGKLIPWSSLLCISVPPRNYKRENERNNRRNGESHNPPVSQAKSSTRTDKFGMPIISSNSIHQQLIRTPSTSHPHNQDSVPAPPDPSKMQKLLEKWGMTISTTQNSWMNPEADEENVKHASTTQSSTKTVNPSDLDDVITPSVAAFFKAAESPQPLAPPPSATSTGHTLASSVINLFPHNYENTSVESSKNADNKTSAKLAPPLISQTGNVNKKGYHKKQLLKPSAILPTLQSSPAALPLPIPANPTPTPILPSTDASNDKAAMPSDKKRSKNKFGKKTQSKPAKQNLLIPNQVLKQKKYKPKHTSSG